MNTVFAAMFAASFSASVSIASIGTVVTDGQAYGLSANGQIAAGVANGGLAAYWNNGLRIHLGFGGSLSDTSSNGRYFAGFSSLSGAPRGFIYDNANGHRVDIPFSSISNGDMKISADGSTYVGTFDQNIISRWRASSGTQALTGMTSFFGRSKAVSGDGSIVAGDIYQSVTRAFVWSAGSHQFLPPLAGGTSDTLASDMTDSGNVIVGRASISGRVEPVRWIRGIGSSWTSQSLGSPDVGGGESVAVTSDGNTIAGMAINQFGDRSGFIWTSSQGLMTVNQYAQMNGVNVDGWRFAFINDMSADGRVIVGSAFPPSSSLATGFILTVPPPASGVLFFAGASGICSRRRTRKVARTTTQQSL